MITEIIIGKKYKVLGQKYTRTPLAIHNGWVFYEHDYNVCPHYQCCRIEIFKTDVEEIPESPEEWFEVVFQMKGKNECPRISSFLCRSKEEFLNYRNLKEESFKFIKLRKVEL